MSIFLNPGACCGCANELACSPCNIPKNNLTVSWVNPIIGNGSTTLTYTAPDTWISGCTNGLIYQLSCLANVLVFKACYHSGAGCTGTQTCCSSSGTAPFTLLLSTYTCTPFSLTYATSSTGCPTLFSSGYTSFTVTNP
jgi:hypothetical protein